MKVARPPFMSVVVISYNGAHTIARTLDSLLAQDYPKDRFEIIVVDDASTDNLGKIVKKYRKVRYIRLPNNLGVSGARNAAIDVARGDVYVSFDDDCIADPKWLSTLAKGYKKRDAVGVGGLIVEPQPIRGLVHKYINATGAGGPPRLTHTETKLSVFKRLVRYVRSHMSMQPSDVGQVVAVEELYGANGSYPVEVLREVKGWDRELSGVEDRDLSRRILAQYPKKRFYSMRDAKVIHEPALSLWQYLCRPYRRGLVNLKFHRRYGIVPPLFPFPVLALGLATYMGMLAPLHVITVLLVVPQLLYLRWPFSFIRTGQWVNLLFPYLQMAEESMVIIGLLRGYILGFKSSHMYLGKLIQPGLLLQLLLIAGWMNMVLRGGPHTVYGTLASILFLLLVPGYVALRALIGYSTKLSLSALISYGVGLGVILLMLVGLATNELFVAMGWQNPLSPRPLAIAVGATTVLAAVAAALRRPTGLRYPTLPWRSLGGAGYFVLLTATLPFLAAGGAITLNNGGTAWLALVAMGLVGLYFLLLIWVKKPAVKRLTPLAVYSLCLSILLGTSLRGWHITGHDIMQEYQVFELTLQHAAWHMSYYQDAYNACLSITILPTVFQRLTHMTDPFVYKFIFQLFFALIAPVMYSTLRHFTTRRIALLALFVFLTFPAFLMDITMLNRQAVALLCFVLALQAGLDATLTKRGKLLVFIFLAGMVLSHYSTSYVAIGVLLLAVLLYPVLRLVYRIFRAAAPSRHIIFPLPVIVATLVLLVTWGSLVTQTSGHISRTLSGVFAGIPAIFGVASGHDTVPDSYSRTGAVRSGDDIVKQYFEETGKTRILLAKEYYSNLTAQESTTSAKADAISPVRIGPVNKHLASILYSAYDHIKQFYGVLIEATIGLGVIFVLCVRSWRSKLPIQYQALILASLIFIGVQVVVPASLINYGLLRVIQQNLIVLALPVVLVCLWLLKLLRASLVRRQQILAVGLVAFYLVLAGFLPALTGGYKPALALSNSGFYYEAYYTHTSEISANVWLAQKTPRGSRVYSDEFARRKMITYSGIFAQPTLVPRAVPVDSYVYLSYGNTNRNVVPAYFNGALIYYAVPTAFLQDHKNLIYSSGDVEIYK